MSDQDRPVGQHHEGDASSVLDEVADVLYGLPASDFVGARNSRAKELAADGDRENAAAVRKLSKPSQAAWLANRLVRAHPDEVNKLIDLRAEFEGAQANAGRDELHTLSRQRRTLIEKLLTLVHDDLVGSGASMTPQVQRQLEATLDAAVADEEAASQLRAGHLTEALHHVGFGGFDLRARGVDDSAQGLVPTGGSRPSGRNRRSPRERRTASAALDEARTALREAERHLRTAARRHETTVQRQAHLADRLARAERERTRAEAELRRAETRLRRAKARLEKS
jgi:hypothetical protein